MGCASSQEASAQQRQEQLAAAKYVVPDIGTKAPASGAAVKAVANVVTNQETPHTSSGLDTVTAVANGAAQSGIAGPAPADGAGPVASSSPRAQQQQQQQHQPPAGALSAATPSTSSITAPDNASAAQDTLLKVSTLMQKFAEVRSERSAPVQVLRKVLDIVVADCQAKFASIQIVSDVKDAALIVALVGSPDKFLERNRFQKLNAGLGYAAEQIVQGTSQLDWKRDAPQAVVPTDWDLIVSRLNATRLTAVPIWVASSLVAILTLAVDHSQDPSQSFMWPSYMQLVAASMSNLMKDTSIPKYIQIVKDIHDATELDALVHKLVGHFRVVLGHSSNMHVWYRLALTAATNASATIFDDLTQVPVPTSSHPRSANSSGASSSTRLIKDVQANGGVIRSVVNMKNTVMKISIHNKQQVMIPDVQKLINQSGNVSIDIFNIRLIKPPTSVLVFPLKVKQHIFGVVFCMSGVQSDFSDVSPRLREVCELMSPHLLQTLAAGSLKDEYVAVQEATYESHGSQSGAGASLAMSLSREGSKAYAIGSSIGGSMSGDHSAITQSRSSTGALVTGLTEKLNQKRIKSAMDFTANNQLADLQVTNLLGEGGFAKVFRGLWQGLVVGIKIVVDDGKNEKMVMKNAHEIAILSTLSHPHVTQAYLCLTDVMVSELLGSCMRQPHPVVLTSPAYKYLAANEDKACHIEVIEYCDLGNLSTGLKNLVFFNGPSEVVLARLAEAAACGQSDASASAEYRLRDKPAKVTINMRSLLLTLIEIANALRYLHRMGVVHCDIKPANVLLKSSNNDPRGFTAKVSDFGLSRVEDDDSSSSFPFNSCGTAAYVAPEALICNKKVDSSVDVYAYGILMWEMYTTQRPYGSMNQQKLVEEVVMRSLRPKFPPHAPEGYIRLAQQCWNGSPNLRPTFEEALVVLNGMLQAMDDGSFASDAPVEVSGTSGAVEYMADLAQQLAQQGYRPGAATGGRGKGR